MKEQPLTWMSQTKPSSHPVLGCPRRLMSHRVFASTLMRVRQESCLSRQAMLAALRQAKLAEWQASGGDFMRSV